MFAFRLITAATVQPLTLEETKEHLRVTHTGDDTLIGLQIEAATSFVEKFLGRALVSQTWEMVIDQFPSTGQKIIQVPLSPLQSITSIKYDDASLAEQTVSSSDYIVDLTREPGRIMPKNSVWPIPYNGIGNVRVRFVAGYAPTTDSPPDQRANVPRGIKQGLLLTIGSLYENREDQVVGTIVSKLPYGAEMILRNFRVAIPLA